MIVLEGLCLGEIRPGERCSRRQHMKALDGLLKTEEEKNS